MLTLVAGALIGGWTGAQVGTAPRGTVALAAGPLREAPQCSASCLTLTVLNAGETRVSILPVAVGRRRLPLGSTEVAARPGHWVTTLLHAPVSCEGPPPERVDTVTVRVSTGERSHRVVLPLPDGVDVPATRYFRLCPPGTPVGSRDLRGWWVSATASLQSWDAAGPPRLRFRGDGTFEVWLVDRRRAPQLAARGEYDAVGRQVTLTVPRVSGRQGDHTSTWRSSRVQSGLLHLARMRGHDCPCALAPGDSWTFERAAPVPVRDLRVNVR